MPVAPSFAHCRRVTRSAKSSFPLAFGFLPPPKRRAMDALYAYFRLTDDLADGPHASREALAEWRARTRAALDGQFTHPIHAALHHTARTFAIPGEELEAVIDGAETDLDPVRFASFSPDLETYCYRVAGVVGRACVRVWGFRGNALDLAVDSGTAFQLTNILRDLGEDRARGRVYLPSDELARFGTPPETWHSRSPAFREMMAFQVARTRDYYRRAEPLSELLTPEGRAVFAVMTGVYRRLLDEIERREFDVFAERIRLGKWAKARVFLGGWPVKWGWT
jgi:phytoene synthase